jgi:hypothetical protein
MNEDSSSRAARETIDKTGAAGTKAVQSVQEGFTSAVENVRDVNVRLIDMARANTEAAFDFAREVAAAKAPSDFVQAWSTQPPSPRSLTFKATNCDQPRAYIRAWVFFREKAAVIPRATVIVITDRTSKSGPN